MRYRTRRLLTGATLFAIACAAALGATNASAASQHRTAKITKISACGYVATKAGTYELTKSIADSGSGTCIVLVGSNITLYLDSHTITGTGTDTCLVVASGGSSTSVKDTVIGGTMPKPVAKKGTKPKAAKPATLSNCHTGLAVAGTSGTTASNLTIVAPANTGVVAEFASGANFNNINVPMHAANSGVGFVLEAGADNVVTNSTVNYDGSQYGFIAADETGDTFVHDTVNDPYNNAGSAGTGFLDTNGSRDTWSHCTSSGQLNGFSLAPNGSGPVTATYDTAKGSTATGSIGFSVVGAFQSADSASPFHTLLSHNTTTGFEIGFKDDNGAVPGAVAETWTNNTADNYSGAGFFINYPTDYTMTGNIADANTSGKKYTGGSTYGFALAHPSANNPFAVFANNQAYDSGFGFYSGGTVVGGKGNIAKRNKYNSHGVEITG